MSAEEFAGMGFAVGVTRGLRAFDVDTLGRLRGVSYDDVWTPGENVAKCHRDRGGYLTFGPGGYITSHALNTAWLSAGLGAKPAVTTDDPEQKHDASKCSCGYYAYYDGSNDYGKPGRVSAVIEGYGETVIGTRGFRAQKARIVALSMDSKAPKRRRWMIATWWFVIAAQLLSLTANVARLGSTGPSTATVIGIVLNLAFMGYGTWALVAARKKRRSDADAAELSVALLSKVQRNYPDVPVFASFKAMVQAFPPDQPEEPTPDVDPDFWTRKVAKH